MCSKCGNKEKFLLTTTKSTYTEVKIITDTHLNKIEFLNEQTFDDNPFDDEERVTCYECEGDEIDEYYPIKSLYDFVYEHTRKDGSWSREKLLENERNDEIYEELFVKEIRRQ